jgi:hypothetical protein
MYCLTNSRIDSACGALALSRNILTNILFLTNTLECAGVVMLRVVVRSFFASSGSPAISNPKKLVNDESYSRRNAVLRRYYFAIQRLTILIIVGRAKVTGWLIFARIPKD